MATKEGDAGLFSDDFNGVSWDKDTAPWTSLNTSGTATVSQVGGTEVSIGFTDDAAYVVWGGTFDGPAIYQTFTDNDWAIEVKLTDSLPWTAGKEFGIMSWESNSDPGPTLILYSTGSDEMRIWSGDAMGGGASNVDLDITEQGITASPWYIKFQRVASTNTYSCWYKQDEEDSYVQAGGSFAYSGDPTQVRIFCANNFTFQPNSTTIDYVYESAAGDPDAPSTRRVMVIG
jgi:hypothetical protein